MRGTSVFEDPETGIQIQISLPAQQMIGLNNLAQFVGKLQRFLAETGAKSAYVGKDYGAIAIFVHRR